VPENDASGLMTASRSMRQFGPSCCATISTRPTRFSLCVNVSATRSIAGSSFVPSATFAAPGESSGARCGRDSCPEPPAVAQPPASSAAFMLADHPPNRFRAQADVRQAFALHVERAKLEVEVRDARKGAAPPPPSPRKSGIQRSRSSAGATRRP
jgi:hypothetical protein